MSIEDAEAVGGIVRNCPVVKSFFDKFADSFAMPAFKLIPGIVNAVSLVDLATVGDDEEEFELLAVVMGRPDNAGRVGNFDEMLELDVAVVSVDANHDTPPVILSF